jgi:predicted dehydrogenase
MSKEMRLGLVGPGHLTETRVLPALREIPEYQLVGALASSPERTALFADAHGLAAADSIGGLAAMGCDAVYIATPNVLHAAQAIEALACGMAVLVEKPCADSLAGALELAEACRRTGGVLLVAYMSKWNRHNILASELIRSGRIGELRAFSGSFGFFLADPQGWRLRRDKSGPGALADLGIYEITTALDLFGEMPLSCSGVAYPAGDPVWGDRFFSGRLRFSDGRFAQISASFLSPSCSYTLTGHTGALHVAESWRQNGDAQVVLFADGQPEKLTAEVINPYEAEFRCLLDCLNGQAVPQNLSVRCAVRDMAVLDALDRSAAAGGQEILL